MMLSIASTRTVPFDGRWTMSTLCIGPVERVNRILHATSVWRTPRLSFGGKTCLTSRAEIAPLCE
jgi:hypothetical protein